MTVLIGTSGYSYQDWVGPVYPPQSGKSEFFEYYSRLFSFTELNFSYYTFPAARTLEALQTKAPSDFRFALKAHRSMTHEADEDLPRRCADFTEAVRPLTEAGSLVSVLLQFPFSFHYTKENRRYLDTLCRKLAALPVHVEFRNDEWQGEKTLHELESRGVGLVASDYPPLKGLPPFLTRRTSPVAYARFHGRNSANWWQGTNVSRYDYRYSMEELQQQTHLIRELAVGSQLLLVAFNNHYKGQAVENAKELQGLLEGE